MPSFSRSLLAAAFVLYGLASAGTAALAQNETSNTIGPPQLKDFTLPGQRTTPPVATPPAPTPPAGAAQRDPPATPPAQRDRAVAEPGRPEPARIRESAAAAAAPASPSPAAPIASTPLATSEPLAPPEARPAAPAPIPQASEPKGGGWLWPAAGGGLLLLLATFLLQRRRRAQAALGQARDSAREALAGALIRAPEAVPAPVPTPPAAPRPWIELDMVPERAAATDSEAVVHYVLTLSNQGEAEARNIRIDPRLFNAGAEADMAAFFQGPIHELSGSPHIVIPPGGTLKLNGQVAMPKSELREIELAGRRIFVPMVAINVAYDWPDGTGRTSRSWLVGREAESPQAKMGPFRLDLGPRIYRSVGCREGRLVRV